MMIGASAVGPLVQKLTRDRVRVEFGDLCRTIYGRRSCRPAPWSTDATAGGGIDGYPPAEINGADSWESNPFVSAYTFALEQKNIDA
jgi:hypothetical protein